MSFTTIIDLDQLRTYSAYTLHVYSHRFKYMISTAVDDVLSNKDSSVIKELL